MGTSDCLEFDVVQLERRLMLAGSVEVKLTGGGDLDIRGDMQGNRILMSSDPNGVVTVRGLGGTTLEFESNTTDEVTVAVTDDVKINLRGGDNTLLISQMLVSDDLSIRLGSGNDVVCINNVDIIDDVSIVTGGGDDNVWLVVATIADKVAVRTGGGQDLVSLGSATLDKLTIATGGDNDDVILVQNRFPGGMTVRAGGGDDNVYSSNFDLGDLKGGSGFDTYNGAASDSPGSFESDAIQAVTAAFAADFDTGNTSIDTTFALDMNPIDAFAATSNVIATANTAGGTANTDTSLTDIGVGHALASLANQSSLSSEFDL